jgi:cytochrome c oxidase accessory protein FixG
MFDEHTLLVTYESWRGEPRGHAKAGQSREGRGDCIDCGLCVRVCPTGIDIRTGQQLDCIGCGLCIDACNSVMSKMGWPGELITYDSLQNQAARINGETPRLKLIRPRTVIYAALLVLVAGVMLAMLSTRARLEVTVQPERAPLFVRLSDGGIQNAYTLKILNKDRAKQVFLLTTAGVDGSRLSVVGHQPDRDGYALAVEGDSVGTFRVLVRANPDPDRPHSAPLRFIVRQSKSGESNDYETVFNGPAG